MNKFKIILFSLMLGISAFLVTKNETLFSSDVSIAELVGLNPVNASGECSISLAGATASCSPEVNVTCTIAIIVKDSNGVVTDYASATCSNHTPD